MHVVKRFTNDLCIPCTHVVVLLLVNCTMHLHLVRVWPAVIMPINTSQFYDLV